MIIYMQAQLISIKNIKSNSGQIEGLPKNPRFIKDDRYKKLVKSLKDDPEMLHLRELIVYPFNNDFIVIAGNMRLKALLELGYSEAPCKVLPADTPVEKLGAYTIKDNIAYGENDWETLANEWDTDKLSDWGLDIPGFATGSVEEDNYEIPDEIETDIVRGDIIEIGQHRLMCGDSSQKEDVEKLMHGELADMVFTDPPYGVSIGAKNRFLNSFQKAGRNLTDIKDDSASADDLLKILLPSFINLREASKPDCTYFVTSGIVGGMGLMMMMMKEAGLSVRHLLIWKKNAPTFSMGKLDYEYQHEPIFLTWTKKHNWYGKGQHRTTVWEIDKPRANKEHPTMKPIALVGNALLNNSKDGDLVIDFFLGSGTTMVAAHQLNRKCYGMEIEPKYCQIIIDRMTKLDSDLEVKINGVLMEKAEINQ